MRTTWSAKEHKFRFIGSLAEVQINLTGTRNSGITVSTAPKINEHTFGNLLA